MATEIQTWEIVDGKMKPVTSTLAGNRRRRNRPSFSGIVTDPRMPLFYKLLRIVSA